MLSKINILIDHTQSLIIANLNITEISSNLIIKTQLIVIILTVVSIIILDAIIMRIIVINILKSSMLKINIVRTDLTIIVMAISLRRFIKNILTGMFTTQKARLIIVELTIIVSKIEMVISKILINASNCLNFSNLSAVKRRVISQLAR